VVFDTPVGLVLVENTPGTRSVVGDCCCFLVVGVLLDIFWFGFGVFIRGGLLDGYGLGRDLLAFLRFVLKVYIKDVNLGDLIWRRNVVWI
jgi:hypothetical protein